MVVEWCIDGARPHVDGIVLVVPPDRLSDASVHGSADLVAAGGATRSASVRAGLVEVPPEAEVIVVHDAARPFASAGLFRAVIAAVRDGQAAAIPGVAISDTIKRVEERVVVETIDRDELVAVQTPQAFRADALRLAHASGDEATDDAALLETIGLHVVVVPGEAANRKLTDLADLELFEYLAGERTLR